MPGFDHTGPEGKGSKTGRKLGKCNPESKQPNQQTDAEWPRRGLGKGHSRFHGNGRGYGALHA